MRILSILPVLFNYVLPNSRSLLGGNREGRVPDSWGDLPGRKKQSYLRKWSSLSSCPCSHSQPVLHPQWTKLHPQPHQITHQHLWWWRFPQALQPTEPTMTCAMPSHLWPPWSRPQERLLTCLRWSTLAPQVLLIQQSVRAQAG